MTAHCGQSGRVHLTPSALPLGVQVTLVAGKAVLERMDPKAQELATKWFTDKGVELVVGERITGAAAGSAARSGALRLAVA